MVQPASPDRKGYGVSEATALTVCHVLECVYNDREDNPLCNFAKINGGIEIGEDGNCINLMPDKHYRTEQFNIRLELSPNYAMLAVRNYENTMSNYTPELRRIMHGETATKLLSDAERIKLRRMGILEMKGRRNFVSPRAQIQLLSEWEEKVGT